jgi:putative hemolysin
VDRDRLVLPKPDYVCLSVKSPGETVPTMPPLMNMYFRYGAKICSYPAIDREFGTIDYLMVMDIDKIQAEVREQFS